MMQQTGHSSSILNLVNKTLELPTMPEVLVKLNEVMADPETSAEGVAEVISRDPAVSTNILRIVNSAYYGLQVRVSSVSLAISVMGFNMTRKVALKAAVFSVFGKRRDRVGRFDPAKFWQHAVFSGVAARILGTGSDKFADSHAEDLYICGLLHDIGKIILLEKAGGQYLPILDKAAETGRPVLEMETEELGFTHADVGSVLAIKWFLPEDLTVAIRYHHCPSKDPFHRPLSSLIHLADHMAWGAGKASTQGTSMPAFDHEVYEHVGLEPQRIEELLPAIQTEYKAADLPW